MYIYNVIILYIYIYIYKLGLDVVVAVASPNCKNFNKFLDFKNKYIHIFWINMTNEVMKESNI